MKKMFDELLLKIETSQIIVNDISEKDEDGERIETEGEDVDDSDSDLNNVEEDFLSNADLTCDEEVKCCLDDFVTNQKRNSEVNKIINKNFF